MIQPDTPIRYCRGYEYQLREPAAFVVPIRPGRELSAGLVRLDPCGRLTIDKYFAWDGCSGPLWDDRTNMRACLVHDALYYLMRVGQLSQCHRPVADEILRDMMLADGAWPLLAEFSLWAVDRFGGPCARPENARRILTAPR